MIYLLLFLASAVMEVAAVSWGRGIKDDRISWVVGSTVFLTVAAYYGVRIVVRDELAIVPAALGHGLGAFAAMRWLPRPKEDVPGGEQDAEVTAHPKVMGVVPDRDPPKPARPPDDRSP